VSYLEDFTDSSFQGILGPTLFDKSGKVNRVIFCSGKVYYDVVKRAEAKNVRDAAIVRVEQLYPLNTDRLQEVVAPFAKAERWVWCQEEPRNMGAWTYISPLLSSLAPAPLLYAGRVAAASTAAGSKAWHDQQQKELVEQAFCI
jgi:2-oxoglutarate dehydrogenase E1 component